MARPEFRSMYPPVAQDWKLAEFNIPEGGRIQTPGCENSTKLYCRRSARRLQAEDALRVCVEDLVHEVVRVAELTPLAEDALVGHAGVVAAEHHLVPQAAAHVAHDRLGEVFGRPARHLPVHVTLVQRNGDRLLDPGPARVSHYDRQLREVGCEVVAC